VAKFDSYYAAGPTSATFIVEVDGRPLGQFREASGLSVTVEVEEVIEGGQNFHTHKLPGRFTFSNVTLRRGITEDNGLIAWIDEVTAGGFEKKGKKLKRSTVAIILTSSDGKRLRTWTLQEAFPVSWKGPDFSLASDDFPVEEVEIAHHGFTVTAGKTPAAKKKAAKKKPAKKKAPAKKAPAKKAPAKKAASQPGYMRSTASSRAKQKPPAKKR
jgi:phage tail-like protein